MSLSRHPILALADLERGPGSQFLNSCQGVDVTFTYDGQGALYQALSSLRRNGRRYALLPAFHCPTVVEPAIRAGLEPRFYRINKDLTIDYRDFTDSLDSSVAAAVIIDYFGFPVDLSPIKAQCRECGVVLVEDWAHSFLSANPIRLTGVHADIAIFSFKKIVASKVGGAIRWNDSELRTDLQLDRPPIRDTLSNVKRIVSDAVSYSEIGRKNGFFEALASVRWPRMPSDGDEDSSDSKSQDRVTQFDYPFHPKLAESTIPWYSRQILKMSALDRVVNLRRRNYRKLHNLLSHVQQLRFVFDELGDIVCPWAFPVLIEERSVHDFRLQELGIPLFTFGETLHPKLLDSTSVAAETIEIARYLSSRVLCFSIHQGISDDALARIGDQISGYFG